MESSPFVSVVMPAYNAEKYLKEAIDSILNQTYKNFEFIIVDDGSTDKTSEIIESYTDNRIKLLKNDKNRGLIYSANIAIRVATGKYIARMDADDISLPERLEKQVLFLEKNNEVSILGTSYVRSDNNKQVHHPENTELIKIYLLEGTTFAHPSVMIRRNNIVQYNLFFQDEYISAEDYALWTSFSMKNLNMANLQDVLVYYRIHNEQISVSKAFEQRETTRKVRIEYAKFYWKDNLTTEDYFVISRLFESVEAYRAIFTLWKIKYLNDLQQDFNKQLFDIFIRKHLLKSYSNLGRYDLLKLLKGKFTIWYKIELVSIFIKKSFKKILNRL
ncbi:glycosyltransferase family 2 protein [Dysgonomonas sp. 520]|uniref:glycosyltransferase family 2 protein n=1 Tax=Dysgonomonas sp. 520 TaxID=2302931 RepID=UPI0013D0CED8|nr:glycosyltransferase family 2 protein [Dysgonomonas sp. 520]NDW09800.1 glycosyltransferase family 2 protein [Dysgonomonas sp. 520]